MQTKSRNRGYDMLMCTVLMGAFESHSLCTQCGLFRRSCYNGTDTLVCVSFLQGSQ